MRLFAVLFFCFMIGVLFSQEQLSAPFQSNYSKALELYEADDPTPQSEELAIGLFTKTINAIKKNAKYSTILMDCYAKAGNIYQGQQQYQKAMPFYHNGIQVARRYNDSFFLYQYYLYSGSAKYSLSEIDSARILFEQAAFIASIKKPLPDLPILYNSLGIIYYEAANYRQAINYFEQAVNSLSSKDESYSESLVSFKNNIAGCYARLGENRKALHQYLSLLPYKQISASLFQNIGHSYYSIGMYDSSLYYLQKTPASNSLTYGRLLNEIARIYMHKGLLSRSEQLFDSSINLIKKLPGYYKNKDKANGYLYRSELAEKQQLYNEAISWCNISLQELHFNFRAKQASDLPTTVNDVVSPVVFFEVLQQKAKLLFRKYNIEKDIHWGEAALQTWLLAIKTANYIKSNFDNDEATLFFNQNYSNSYKNAAALAATLYGLTQKKEYKDAFLFITESYKGNVLYANLKNNTTKEKGLIPDSLLAKEQQLKQLLTVFTNRLNATETNEGAQLIRYKITDIQVQLSRLQKQFERFPAYKKSLGTVHDIDITASQVQKNTGAGKAVLQFMWTDSLLLLFACTSDETILKKIEMNKSRQLQLDSFIQALYYSREGLRFTGHGLAAKIHTMLKNELPAAIYKQKQWVVIPDGKLNYIPFETLMTNADTRAYLAEEKIISYHYSILTLLSQVTYTFRNSNIYAAAPFNNQGIAIQNSLFPQLPNSGVEIEMWRGEKLKDADATKQTFIKTAPQSTLIHLATHAVAQSDSGADNQTYIQFFSKTNQPTDFTRLYLHELYTMRFTEQPLVILSACETAAGKSGGGEGLLSLSRGFLYGGCSGIISSMWKAEDRVTAYIVSKMQLYLQENYSPEEALHYARIDFLNDKTMDARYKSPNYWGHFIYAGALDLKSNGSTYKSGIHKITVVVVVLILLLITWYIKKSYSASRRK